MAERSGSGSSVPPVRRRWLLLAGTAQFTLLVSVWTTLRLALGDPWAEALITGVIFGLLWTAFHLGVELYRRKDRLRANPYSLAVDQRRTALDASAQGPLPDDPLVRREALRLARAYHAQHGGTSARAFLVVAAVVGVGAGVAGAVASPWWWLLGAIVLLAAGFAERGTRQGQARLRLLEESVR